MKKGGYQIIDLKSKPFTVDTGMVYEGIYDLIEGTTKPIYVSGLNIGGTEYHDVYVPFYVNESNYVGDCYGHTIEVQDNDVVTIKKNQ